ncbi:uncharacterized protein NMK_3179 [Novimethylophilus kurashikiensis]|uniref:DUF4340 domain-containing protein n=1 Tax=Novimethylophilus kurashikiensis TaxID=1825523 RepID=A0A2R5FDJ5_9PROT|nr:DUF4340 domain-containing protein [Novimethylophilus kurashikiensis]GBG15568.1 uncharacterized protein NMK_3179 [Novimethylophilus kurashikiensis]
MKSRWIVNLVLLLLVAGIAAFLYLRPKTADQKPTSYALSQLNPNKFEHLNIEVPGKKPVVLEKQGGRWRLLEPAKGRADLASVGRVLSLAIASSAEKFPATDLTRFGLDHPALTVRMDNEEFTFGMYHPVTGDQYIKYKGAVYLLPTMFSEGASMQPLEFLDKHPLDLNEEIVGFDFSGLEQWEKSRLSMQLENGKWKVSAPDAKPKQDELKEWFSNNWQQLTAKSVEPAKLDGHPQPWFSVKLKSGKVVKFLKLQESPELLLVREDEGLLYHFSQDTGFTILNPPVGYKE